MPNIITTPTLLLDSVKAKANISTMAEKAANMRLKFRPHFKTHQSKEIGNWFREYKIDGITVSSLKMAEYFVEDGWRSITIAFPANILEVNELSKLASDIDLRVLAVNADTLSKLDKQLSSNLGIYIEIDPGYGRSGVPFDDYITIEQLIASIEKSSWLCFKGFYSHAGHSYRCRSMQEIRTLSSSVIQKLSKLKSEFNYPVCFGDTPSCSVLEDFGTIDEISPGNFVFYDWNQTQIGSCIPDQIAIAMKCPVVAKYPARNELLIHGGAVHFSKDYELDNKGNKYFGTVVEKLKSGWSSPVSGCVLKSVSQEHGIVACSKSFFAQTDIGDTITILPIHSCLTADLMGGYTTDAGNKIDHLSKNYK